METQKLSTLIEAQEASLRQTAIDGIIAEVRKHGRSIRLTKNIVFAPIDDQFSELVGIVNFDGTIIVSDESEAGSTQYRMEELGVPMLKEILGTIENENFEVYEEFESGGTISEDSSGSLNSK